MVDRERGEHDHAAARPEGERERDASVGPMQVGAHVCGEDGAGQGTAEGAADGAEDLVETDGAAELGVGHAAGDERGHRGVGRAHADAEQEHPDEDLPQPVVFEPQQEGRDGATVHIDDRVVDSRAVSEPRTSNLEPGQHQ